MQKTCTDLFCGELVIRMVNYLRRSWAVVNLDNVAHNVKEIRKKIRSGCMIMGVVKADAYGHGDKFIADELIKLGINWFAVSNFNEAISLRTQGIFHPILILGMTPPGKAKQLCEYNITQTVYSMDYAKQLQDEAEKQGVTVQCHIKIDSGMGRIGFDARNIDEAVDQIKETCKFKNLQCDGIFTHFSSADEFNNSSIDYTHQQFERFKEVNDRLEKEDIRFSLHHCCNSGGIVNYPEYHWDMVRAGILLYGLIPDSACKGKIELKPVMELKAVISMIKNVKAGSKISYGRTFTAPRDMRIATVPIGYADGYHRSLSNRGKMLVNGKYAKIVGRICMDQLLLDVTEIPEAQEGMEATIVGHDGENTITMEEIARLSDTIHYEIMCIIGKRVPRVYTKNGENVGVVDYIRHNVE